MGIRPDGRREVLGFWLFGAEGESARGWRQVVRKIFPSSKWQLCVLHTVRDTLAKVRKKDREALAQDLKAIYRADTIKQAHRALRALEEKWAGKYPELVAKWLDKRPSRSS